MTRYPRVSHRTWVVTLHSVAMGFCVFLLGSALAEWLSFHNIHGFLALVDNFMAGIGAGLIVLLYERSRQREIDKKLRTIRLMNHHVRNALQVISTASDSVETEQPTMVQDAVRRIEWALREVLPGERALTDNSEPPNPRKPKKESAA